MSKHIVKINGEEKEFKLTAMGLIKLKREGIDISNQEQMSDIETICKILYIGVVENPYEDFEEMAENLEVEELMANVKVVAQALGGKNKEVEKK